MAGREDREEFEAVESVRRLLKAGLELGVAEAVRRIATLGPASQEGVRDKGAKALLGSASVVELVQFIRNDPSSVFHLAKEVWSRGGGREKAHAAEAIGTGLGFFVPHKALDAAKELASMARNRREADLVGRKAIEPVLERSPALIDRVRKYVEENERLIRQAAIAGLVAYVGRRRKYAALGVEILLLVAEEHEKEIRQAVKSGLKKMMEVDAKATATAVTEWVKANPTAERVQTAAGYLTRRVADVRDALERGVLTTLGRFNGAGKPAPSKPGAKARSKPRTRAAPKKPPQPR